MLMHMKLTLSAWLAIVWAVTVPQCQAQGITDANRANVTELRLRAAPADRLVDSIGINVHLGFFNTTYKDFDLVRDKVRELGIRHLRDHAVTRAGYGPNHEYYQRIRKLAAD